MKKLLLGLTTVSGVTVLAVMLLLASKPAPAQTPPSQPGASLSGFQVVSYQLMSQKRLSTYLYEYTYKATIQNTGVTALTVVGKATTTAPGVTFVDDALSFGDVISSATATSADTFVLRQDRRFAFSANMLSWKFDFAGTTFVEPSGGYTVKVPENTVSDYSASDNSLRVIPNLADPILENDTPGIFVSVDQNPGSLTFQQYYDGDPGLDLIPQSGGIYTTINVNGFVAYRLEPLEGLVPSVEVIIVMPGRFVTVLDLGMANQENGVFQRMLDSITAGS